MTLLNLCACDRFLKVRRDKKRAVAVSNAHVLDAVNTAGGASAPLDAAPNPAASEWAAALSDESFISMVDSFWAAMTAETADPAAVRHPSLSPSPHIGMFVFSTM